MSEEKKDKKVNLHEGHRARMRERFRKSGFSDFNEHQIIELLLFYTSKNRHQRACARSCKQIRNYSGNNGRKL